MPSNGFRLSYTECRALLRQRLAETPPGRLQLLTGPRQVGKTTLLLELAGEHTGAALYAAGDGPDAALPGFWERLWQRAEQLAAAGPAVLLLDEIHLLHDWAARLKGEWDRIRRRKTPLHIVATGSSALHLSEGSRESLAGRFEKITLTHWTAASLAASFDLPLKEAAEVVVSRGSYPGTVIYLDDPTRWSGYVRDAIIEPAIGRDILALGPVRRPALLRQVFSSCAASPAQIVSLQKLQGQLQDSGALETIAHYLELLEDAYLIAPLKKYAARANRRRSAPPKLITLSNAFLAAVDVRGPPTEATDPARFGTWVENACLAHVWNCGQQLTYWREEPHEVDGVIEGTWGSWAIEVKTGRFTTRDLHGLLEFNRRFPSYRPLVIGSSASIASATRAGVDAVTWHDFLVKGLPGALDGKPLTPKSAIGPGRLPGVSEK